MPTTQNRPMRRFDRELTRQQAYDIIDAAPFAVVGTADDAGVVYGVPVNPVRVDNVIYFHTTSSASRRNDNIKAHPQVCMTFVSESEVLEKLFSCNYACAVVEGNCVEVTDPEERLTALKALCARWAPTNDEARNVAYIGKHIEGVSVWRVQMQFVSGKARQPRA